MPEKNLYLEDLYVGQTFVSGEHALDETQSLPMPGSSIPSPFTPIPRPPSTASSRGWQPAAGTRPLSACAW